MYPDGDAPPFLLPVIQVSPTLTHPVPQRTHKTPPRLTRTPQERIIIRTTHIRRVLGLFVCGGRIPNNVTHPPTPPTHVGASRQRYLFGDTWITFLGVL